MFSELGLNIARQHDNGANPRPDNRSGWLDGETPDVVEAFLDTAEDAGRRGHRDQGSGTRPSSCATPRRTRSRRGRTGRPTPGRRSAWPDMTDIEARLQELRDTGLYRRMRMICGPQGPRVVLDGKPVLLLCSNNYLGLADHPRVREAAADAAMRWGVGAGASRLVSGTMTIHRRLEERLADVQGHRGGAAVRLGLPGQRRRHQRARAHGRGRLLRRAQPRVDHRRLPARRAPRRSSTTTATLEHLEYGLRQARRPRGADRHRLRLLDGRRRRAAGRASSSSRSATARGSSSTRRTAPAAVGPGRARRGRRGRASRARSTSSSARSARRWASYGAYAAAARRCRAVPRQQRALADLLDRAAAAGRRRRAGGAGAAHRAAAARREAAGQRRRAARRARARGLRRRGLDDADRPADRRRRRAWRCGSARSALEHGVFAQAIRPPTVPEGTSRLRLAVMASHTKAELREAARCSGARRCRRASGPGAGVPIAEARRQRNRPRRACLRRRRRSRPSRRRRVRGVFVTGTDTGVGKTSSRRRSCAALRADGVRVGAFKPVLTGLEDAGPQRRRAARARSRRRHGAPPLRPAGLAAPGGAARRRRRSTRRRSSRPRGPRARRATCSSSRASAACSCR